MTLPGFVLTSKINKIEDNPNQDACFDPAHYSRYPWPVVYQYNSRGYRDQEWPEDLHNAIWCFGDSFTVGIGSPWAHTWCYCLQYLAKQRTINISLNGASNNWIARKVQELLAEVIPPVIVVQWSYIHRRESDVNDIGDEFRVIHHEQYASTLNDVDNFVSCVEQVESAAARHSVTVIHSFIPDFVDPAGWESISPRLIGLNHRTVPRFDKLDLARDAHHYDVITATYVAEQAHKLIVQHRAKS